MTSDDRWRRCRLTRVSTFRVRSSHARQFRVRQLSPDGGEVIRDACRVRRDSQRFVVRTRQHHTYHTSVAATRGRAMRPKMPARDLKIAADSFMGSKWYSIIKKTTMAPDDGRMQLCRCHVSPQVTSTSTSGEERNDLANLA